MSTPGTCSSKSVLTKKNGKGRINKFISSITSRQLKNNKVVTAHDARKNVRNTKSIDAKKTITKNEDNEIDELISFKKEVFARQTVHDKEKLQIEEKRMLFDERRLELEEKSYYANQKKDIAVHNLQMLKMRKQAREEYRDDFNEEDIEAMFPFRKDE